MFGATNRARCAKRVQLSQVLNEEEHRLAHNNQYNFDHPDAFDFKLLIETLKKLKEGKRVEVPIYNFVSHSRDKRLKFMYGANVIIFEGILSFSNKQLLEVSDLKSVRKQVRLLFLTLGKNRGSTVMLLAVGTLTCNKVFQM